ncbi:ABC transporter substrate-binding protein [Desulfosporosinus sp. Sb-LF]|uniref:ABC transporter substrate-binding protein n=1 Tax=Desulfosporosinus sp. Sb-LF TaxID=2560027 RepID=UPI00107F5B11|nr:ABC transporter substrate-binding protein [Desulfosporosinus sp. Sb-LF]TGE34583.1 ABC transporter substrate-binding protein [Desulfosporosinus sp. Sb-LF]
MLLIILSIFLVLTGCSQVQKRSDSSAVPTNLLKADWNEVLTQAKGQTVNMYMWGGSESINRYMDEWIAPRLKKDYGVTLNRVPVNDINDVINKLLAEKQVNKTDGSVDLIWINGENFKNAKEHQLLWGSFDKQLPNFNQYIDANTPDIKDDFGLPTEGYEAPWGKAQFVFIYDSNKIKIPPTSMLQLANWVKQNPGKFTYPAPPDFTGSAFVRHALYETTGGYQQYMKPLDSKTLTPQLTPVWDYLKSIKPFLWREGSTYPESLAKLDQLYANGEVWMTMGYDPARASNEIKKGTFPVSTRTFVLEKGTLANTHYLSIPFNSTHRAGAMVAINFMLSPEAQIAKFDPVNWGEDMSLDLKKMSPEDQKRISGIDRGIATLSVGELASHRLPELPSEYVDFLDTGWLDYVARK